MARKKSIVSNMSIEDILNIDMDTFVKLNTKQLKKIVSKLVSVGNKRIRNLEKAEEYSPAYRSLMKHGGKFSVKGKNLNQLRAEYIRAKNYFESETSTKRGWNKVKRETIQKLKEEKSIEITAEQFDRFWKAYEDLKELSPEVANEKFKYMALRDIANVVDDISKEPDEIALEIDKKLSALYEKAQKEQEEQNNVGVSSFFTT